MVARDIDLKMRIALPLPNPDLTWKFEEDQLKTLVGDRWQRKCPIFN